VFGRRLFGAEDRVHSPPDAGFRLLPVIVVAVAFVSTGAVVALRFTALMVVIVIVIVIVVAVVFVSTGAVVAPLALALGCITLVTSVVHCHINGFVGHEAVSVSVRVKRSVLAVFGRRLFGAEDRVHSPPDAGLRLLPVMVVMVTIAVQVRVDPTQVLVHVGGPAGVVPVNVRARHGGPVRIVGAREEPHGLHVEVRVHGEAMLDARGKFQEISGARVHPDPLVVEIANVKVPAAIDHVTDLVSARVDVLLVELLGEGGHHHDVGVLVVLLVPQLLQRRIVCPVGGGAPRDLLGPVGIVVPR